MKLKDAEGWAKARENNKDPYGKGILDYAEAWADEMERRMALGEKIADMAKEVSHEVDRRPGFGITGFMYGAAVSMLAHGWEHGEELRQWHNLDVQLGKEGEKANREGTVLNPAILSIG